ncbi:MAG: hypothetical protein L0Z50_12230 [Verrucomicrobiales bacterium]|nr:hypothetical protein [Verrucomicrobiales bacterium]
MKLQNVLMMFGCLLASLVASRGQPPQGPFPPEQWPASADGNKVVHFVSVGDTFQPVGAQWVVGNMSILSGGDQVTEPIRIGGFDGLKVIGNYLNTADGDYTEWADDEEIDILMQVYGDGALFQANGDPQNFSFLIGTLPELEAPNGGQLPVEARNRKWNWVLFRIPNTTRPSDGTRRVGSIPANAQGGTQAGGVNGGTIRLEGVPNLIVRVIAFGVKGAFGEPEQVNVFAPAEQCPAEPATNHAWINLANNQNDHMQVLNNGDQAVTISDSVGPDNDKRRAVRPNGLYMNFAVTDDFLGRRCNDARAVKICVEFFDDPALAGRKFGPEAFATDDQGGMGFVSPDRYHTLTGSGKWERRSWTIPAVSLAGINTAPLTAGPRLFFEESAPIFISRFDLGIFRIGQHPLAGQDPLSDCFDDPLFCTGIYGNYAELDLAKGIMDGLAPGNSGGDQEMIQAEAGPTSDRRMAIRPARDDGSAQFQHVYLNLAITDEKLGPSAQPGVRLAICVSYYDDPALVGAQFRPEVYISDRGGNTGFAFTSGDIAVRLEGTDTWRDAYFEITDVKFNGVNQGPQAAARFFVSDKVFFSRVRYGVIRPCGPQANVNPIAECKPQTDVLLQASVTATRSIRLAWPASAEGFILEENDDIAAGGSWKAVTTAPVTEGDQLAVTLTPSGTKFFRLRK